MVLRAELNPNAICFVVAPKAGVHSQPLVRFEPWVPAFAGMTTFLAASA
jgi:hypothetical protein